MNTRERMSRQLDGGADNGVCCGPLAVHYCAAQAGISMRDYSHDPVHMAEAIIRYHDAFKPDAVWVSADTWVTAEAMGAAVFFPDEQQPMSGHPLEPLVARRDLSCIPAPNPMKRGRQPVVLEALTRVREALGDDAFIVGCFDQAPFSLACALLTPAGCMQTMLHEPDFLTDLLQLCADHGAAYGAAMARAGADMLSMGDSPVIMVSPEHYEQWALPAERAVFQRIKQTCPLPCSLHVCGDAAPYLTRMASSCANVLELDAKVDLARALQVIPGEMALWGNLDPVGSLLNGSPEAVRDEVHALIDLMRQAGRSRFVVSSGCTLAPETPAANLHAMIRACRERQAR